MDTIEQRITEFLSRELGIDASEITPDSRIGDLGGPDIDWGKTVAGL